MLLTILPAALLAAAEPTAGWKPPPGWRADPVEGSRLLEWQGPGQATFSLTRLPQPVDASNRAVIEALLRAGLSKMSAKTGLRFSASRSLRRYTSPGGVVVDYLVAEPARKPPAASAKSRLLLGHTRHGSSDLVVHLAGPSPEETLREILGEPPARAAEPEPPAAPAWVWLWPALAAGAILATLIRRRWTR